MLFHKNLLRARMKHQVKLTIYGIITNFFLFLGKLTVALLSGSIAVFSDAFNSLVDVLSSTVTFFAVRISHKRADKEHPIGHHQAEPIAGLLIAIFAFSLAIEILQGIINTFLDGYSATISILVFVVMSCTIIVKIIMSFIFLHEAKIHKSPALKANGIDSRNDVFASFLALIGIVFTYYGYAWLEVVAAFAIALLIIYTGYELAKENIKYLMGGAISKVQFKKIEERILAVYGVKGHGNLKAFYSGNYVNVEVEIYVNDKKSLKDASHIRDHVREVVLSLPYVNHVDVYLGTK